MCVKNLLSVQEFVVILSGTNRIKVITGGKF